MARKSSFLSKTDRERLGTHWVEADEDSTNQLVEEDVYPTVAGLESARFDPLELPNGAQNGADYRGEVRSIVQLPDNVEVGSSAEMYEYDTRVGRIVRRRKRLFNVGTQVGKLTITGIVQSVPSYGTLDRRDPDAKVYRRAQFICDCVCGRSGLVRSYDYLYDRGELAYCGVAKEPTPDGLPVCSGYVPRYKYDVEYVGRVVGRLKVLKWIHKVGWECVCELCGQTEIVRYSHLLERAGSARKCKAPPHMRLDQPRLVKRKSKFTSYAGS